MTELDLPTPDGACRTRLFEPPAPGPFPAVVFFMDGVGPRPALFSMAERLAAEGYLVALPDLFHRTGPYDPAVLKSAILDAQKRVTWRETYFNSATNPDHARADARAVLEYFASRGDVGKVGAVGYCMGGGLALTAAGNFPERIAAAASFHGGFLASDAPNSPHLLAPKLKARVYVAAATEDQSFPESMKARLEAALTDARVDHRIETYPARHGWAISDAPTWNEAASDRHWTALLKLFSETLR